MKNAVRGFPACLAVVLAFVGPASAQESQSAALAARLTAALQTAGTTTIAAKDPDAPEVFFGALHLPGIQLLAITARYAAPAILEQRIAKQAYREVYVDLNSASERATRVLVTDMGADGLHERPQAGQAPDGYDANGRSILFDRDWDRQGLSEAEYMKLFAAAEEHYAAMLTALIAQIEGGP